MEYVEISLLLKDIANDDDKSFEKIYNHYFKRSFACAIYYIKEPALAEDIVADVFMNVWRNRQSLPSINNFDNFLFVCIRNQALIYMKKRNISRAFVGEEHLINYKYDGPTPEDQLIRKEFQQKLKEAICSLPHKTQIVYNMVREQKLSYKEISTILNISERTINSHMTTSTKRIVAIMKKYLKNSTYTLFAYLASSFF